MAHQHININYDIKAPTPLSTPPALPPQPCLIPISEIRQNIAWIRDTLDLLVAREGNAALKPYEVLAVHAFLGRVRIQPFKLETIRQTRLYQMLTLLRGKATRWPRVIIDECDDIIKLWTVQFGSLRGLRTPLYENGGRLFGICKARDVTTSVCFAFCSVFHSFVSYQISKNSLIRILQFLFISSHFFLSCSFSIIIFCAF